MWFIASLGRSRSEAKATNKHAEDLRRLTAEIGTVAQYVSGLRREIGLLRAHEVFRGEIPRARRDLSEVRSLSASSVGVILEAAERLLSPGKDEASANRADVEARAMEILEACAFQDIAGQRLKRVDDALALIERRLQRFALASGVADRSDGFDRQAIEDEVRREMLIVEGPQASGEAADQAAIDRMFA